eukprot:scaffold19279_cov19-Tisochrysis_lutea.AAC.5
MKMGMAHAQVMVAHRAPSPKRTHSHAPLHTLAQAFTAVDNNEPIQEDVVNKFKQDPVHAALAKCSEMRPPVDVSVGGEGSNEGIGAGGARIEYRSTAAKA